MGYWLHYFSNENLSLVTEILTVIDGIVSSPHTRIDNWHMSDRIDGAK